MPTPNLAKIVKALVDNPDGDPIQIIRNSGGEDLSKEELAIVFEMSVAEFLARGGMATRSGAGQSGRAIVRRAPERHNLRGGMSHQSGTRK
jgi:hypothetical protein